MISTKVLVIVRNLEIYFFVELFIVDERFDIFPCLDIKFTPDDLTQLCTYYTPLMANQGDNCPRVFCLSSSPCRLLSKDNFLQKNFTSTKFAQTRLRSKKFSLGRF